MAKRAETLEEMQNSAIRRLLEYTDMRGPDEWWEWQRARNWAGYGMLSVLGKAVPAHRFAYEVTHGEILKDRKQATVDHICNNKGCVNPNHLQLLSMSANTRRAESNPVSINAKRTHCKSGHEFTEANIYRVNDGKWRQCRACRRISTNKWNATRKG